MLINKKEIGECYDFLNHGGVTEIRLIDPRNKKPPISEFVSSKNQFINTCEKYNGNMNVYAGINERNLKGTRGDDVISVKTIVIDIDAIRKKDFEKQPATNNELEQPKKIVDSIIKNVTKSGQVLPTVLHSGNGYQLWFSIPEIIITDENRKRIENKLQLFQDLIKNKFDLGGNIDKIGDLPRIIKVWGTLNVKGKNIKERPHRVAKIISGGSKKENTVLRQQLMKLEDEPEPIKITSIKNFNRNYLPRPLSYLLYDYKHETPDGWMRIIEVFSSFFRGIGLQKQNTLNEILLWTRRQPYKETGEEKEVDEIVSRIYKNEIMCPNFDKLINKEEGYPFFGLKNKFKGIDLGTDWASFINPIVYYKAKSEAEPKKNYELIWEQDMDDYEMEEKTWLIDKIIPSCSLGVWTGKRGTFKTFLVLSAIFAIASGKPFLGRFETLQSKIIYLDKENGLEIMRQRKNMIKKGLGIVEGVPVGFICFSQLKLDKIADMMEIDKLIKIHKPKLLIVDTYRRGISFEENDAGKVSWLFVDILRPIIEKYKISILLIHHDRKGESQGDEMDMIRGSSDLANYADFIMRNERRGKRLILKQLKMRAAQEIEPIEINMETDEITNMSFISCGDYSPQTQVMKCAEKLILWIIKDGIEEFTTSQAKEIAFKEGIKETNFKNALVELQTRGMITKIQQGRFKVISKDGKLIV